MSRAITREPTSNEKHENRIRSFPHEPGNWATFVHIPVFESFELTEHVEHLLSIFSTFNLNLIDDFHVSLTRTVVLKHHWIQGFVKSVRECLNGTRSFLISFSGLKVYLNDDKTRTFVGLEAVQGTNELKAIVQHLDKCLLEYSLPVFYKNPSFHLSVLWCVGDRYSELSNCLKNIQQDIFNFNYVMEASYCNCSSGNKRFSFGFKQKYT